MKVFNITNSIAENLEGSETEEFYKFLQSSPKVENEVSDRVLEIISQVKLNGDKSLIELSNKFDKTSFKTASDLCVTKEEIKQAENSLSKDIKKSLDLAYKRIAAYHKKQLPKDFKFKDSSKTELGNLWRVIEKIGIYVPGGTASYPSSVLMSAVPALVAGVKEIVMCAPSNSGKLNPAVLYAAQLCGIKKIYKIGGAQAIAALAYGTRTVESVNKIVGPGNAYVACAKKILFGEVGIDMIAGPTDVTIIADNRNNASWISADALSQLEHGADSKAFIITDDTDFAHEIIEEIKSLKSRLSREKIINESLKNSAIFVIKNLNQSVHLANYIAPEHLQIATRNAKKFVNKITNAGAIFLGEYTPEAIGDYIAGPSHTLPTSASAKFSSGLSVYDFLKRISLISCGKKSFAKLSDAASILAESEGLTAHKLSIDIRK